MTKKEKKVLENMIDEEWKHMKECEAYKEKEKDAGNEEEAKKWEGFEDMRRYRWHSLIEFYDAIYGQDPEV